MTSSFQPPPASCDWRELKVTSTNLAFGSIRTNPDLAQAFAYRQQPHPLAKSSAQDCTSSSSDLGHIREQQCAPSACKSESLRRHPSPLFSLLLTFPLGRRLAMIHGFIVQAQSVVALGGF